MQQITKKTNFLSKTHGNLCLFPKRYTPYFQYFFKAESIEKYQIYKLNFWETILTSSSEFDEGINRIHVQQSIWHNFNGDRKYYINKSVLFMKHESEKLKSKYDKMINSEKKALMNARKPEPKEFFSVDKNAKQSSHRDATSISKNKQTQNFRSYMKDKVAEMKNNKNQSKNLLPPVNKNNKEYNEPKPFPQIKKRSQTQSENNATQMKNKMEKLAENKVGSLNKVKTTSNNFQQKMQRNVVKDQQQSQPPGSKHSIRIRQPGLAKKLMEDLLKINQAERRLQSEIINLHNDNKYMVEQMTARYSIKTKLQQEEEGQIPFDSILEEISKKSQNVKKQERKLGSLSKSLEELNKQIKKRKTNLKKSQTATQSLPLVPFLNQIQEISQQSEEEQSVHEIPLEQNKILDPTQTYQNTMGEMRKKKWGLNKRINYEGKRQENSRVFSTDRQVKSIEKVHMSENGENKVVVNQRFKELLLE